MEKPNLDLATFPLGKIFQINPLGENEINQRFGGDFIVATTYKNSGVEGYLACVYENAGLVRTKGVGFIFVKWEDLEFVGAVEWFPKIEIISSSESSPLPS